MLGLLSCRHMPVRTLLTALTVLLLAACSVHARDEFGNDNQVNYNRDIRPILAEHCFACHGTDSGSRKADLRLDQRESAIDSGAISDGDPEASEIIARVESADEATVMPPRSTNKPLTQSQKNLLRRWIAAGAPYEPHWAFIKPEKKPAPEIDDPAHKHWARNDIDRFVLEKLNDNRLKPSAAATPNQLIRRLSFDITGLPPTPGQVDDFIVDHKNDPDRAVAKWVDRLMESPAWGEHRARYWLDAARYGDTHGLHYDNYREIWPYRDWVIRSFNINQPYDQFTIEQLAGDLLDSPDIDQLVATGFQRCGITTNEGGTIEKENLALYAADRVQTFGWVYLGLTTNCCQCHDHKFDPVTIKDYYSLAAYFRNTTQPGLDGNVKDGRGAIVRVPHQRDMPRYKALSVEINAARQAIDAQVESNRKTIDKWIADLESQQLSDPLPRNGLVVHVPLNDGKDDDANEAKSEEVASAIPGQGPFKTENKPKWKKDAGLNGPALKFANKTNVNLGAAGDFAHDQAFSCSAWVNTESPAQNASIVARMDESAGHRGWDMWAEGRRLGMHIIHKWPDNCIKVVTRDEVFVSKKWQHVCLTWDRTGKPEGIRLYVDGKHHPHKISRNNFQPESSIRTKTPLRIGRRSTGGGYRGMIQGVRIYERKLDSAEIVSLHDSDLLMSILETEPANRTREQNETVDHYVLAANSPQFNNTKNKLASLKIERDVIELRSPMTHIQKEKPSPAKTHILMRGQYDQPGAEVAAAPPQALHPLPQGAPPNRLGLAQWVVDPANPLTARVTVNRFWQEVFGQGLVVTSEDFGVMGSPPSHPELLDWLAVDFQENGWNVKRLFRQIFTSATYRQASVFTAENRQRDPDNRLLSRGPRFRMDAEMIRDNALAASGLLSEKMYGPGVKPYQPTNIWDVVGLPSGDTRKYVQSQGDDLYRRTLYNFWKRMAHSPNMDTLNAPSREVCTVRRERTNTPLAALVTLNDPQFVESARKLAELAIVQQLESDLETINFIAKRLISREFTAAEAKIILTSHERLHRYYRDHEKDATALISVGDSKPDPKIPSVELAAWTATCNQLLNLDEVLNK